MKTSTLDKLIWTFVYSGLIAVALGLSVQRTHDAIGWGLVVVGTLVGMAGAALLVVRARIKDTPGDT